MNDEAREDTDRIEVESAKTSGELKNKQRGVMKRISVRKFPKSVVKSMNSMVNLSSDEPSDLELTLST